MTQTITTQQKSTRWRHWKLFGLILAFLLTGFAGLQAQTVNWGLVSASDVSVGSSKTTEIAFGFEIRTSNLTNGTIEVTLPYVGEVCATSVSNTSGIVLSTPPTWSDASKTLTFSNVNMPAGQGTAYTIPHSAADFLNFPANKASGDIIINVKDAGGTVIGTQTIPCNYLRTALVLSGATNPTTKQTGFKLDFENNNGVHSPSTNTFVTYQLQLSGSYASVDELKVVFDVANGMVEFANWKVGTKDVSSQIVVSKDLTILTIKKEDFPGGNGLDAGETVSIYVDVKKNYCSTNNVNIYTYFGTDATNYQSKSDVALGAFAAEESVGIVKLERGTFTRPTMYIYDGVTPNIFFTELVNTGASPVAGIEHTIIINSPTATIPYSAFLDANTLKYSLDGGDTWIPLTPGDYTIDNIVPSAVVNYTINPIYRGLPLTVTVSIPGELAIGKSIKIQYGSIIAPDFYISETGKDRITSQSTRVDEKTSYMDQCRSGSYAISAGTYLSQNNAFIALTSYNPSIILKTGDIKAIKTTDVQIPGFISYLNPTPDAYCKLRVVLPKGVTLSNSGMNYAELESSLGLWAHTGSVTSTPSGDVTIYELNYKLADRPTKAASGDLYTLTLNYAADCGSVTENVSDLVDISFDLYPTGQEVPDSQTDIVFPRAVQLYNPISVVCFPDGFTYDFSIERLTVGKNDSNNDWIFDSGIVDKTKIDHSQLLPNNLFNLNFVGTVTDAKTELYAIVYSDKPQSYIKLQGIPIVTAGTYSALDLNVSLDSRNSSYLPIDRGTSVPVEERYAYVVKITKVDESPFNLGDEVNLSFPFQAVYTTTGTTPITINISSWAYVSDNIGGTDPLNPTSFAGEEKYSLLANYYPIFIGGGQNVRNDPFEGEVTKELPSFYYQIGRATEQYTFSPFEHRNLAIPNILKISAPEGFSIANDIEVMIYSYVGTGATSTSSTARIVVASILGGTPMEREYNLKALFDIDGTDDSKVPLPDGYYVFNVYPTLTSSYALNPGSYKVVYTTDFESDDYPSLNTERVITAQVQYIDNGSIVLSYAGNFAQPMTGQTTSWDINVKNTKSDEAKDVWLYVEGGVVTNSSIKIGAQTYYGEGDDNRWIRIPSVAASSNIVGSISVDYMPADCSSENITVYSMFDRDLTTGNWTPCLGALNSGCLDAVRTDKKLYSKLSLTVSNPGSIISGSITSLSTTPSDITNGTGSYGLTTVAVDAEFPVEIIYSAEASVGGVSKATANAHFPEGLAYAGSAYIEYKGSHYSLAGTALEAELQKLVGGEFDGPQNLTLKLSDAAPAVFTTDVLDGGEVAILRFKLKPTCFVSLNAKQITASFTGERPCGGAAVSGGQIFRSSALVLSGITPAYEVGVKLSLSKSAMSCQSTENTNVATLSFQKKEGASSSVGANDEISITLPESVKIPTGGITYSSDALASATGGVSPISGSISDGNISTNLVSGLTTWSWKLPKDYFDLLASTGYATTPTVTYVINLEFVSSKATSKFDSDIMGAVSNVITMGGSCDPRLGVAGFKETALEVNPVPVIDDMSDIEVCSGEDVSQIDLEGNFSDAGYGYSWSFGSTDIGQSADDDTDNIPLFTASNGTASPVVAIVTVTPTYGTCTGTAKTFTITVNPKPVVAVTDPSDICAGSTVNLEGAGISTPTPATATLKYYTANDGTGTELTGIALTVSPATTTVYYVQATNGTTGCVSDFEAITVTVNPLPTFTATQKTICSGNSVLLSDAVSGVTSGATVKYYTKNDGTGTELTGAGLTVSPTSTTTYYAQATTTATSCVSDYKAIVVTVNPLPDPTITGSASAAPGQSGMVYYTEGGMTGYSWSITSGSGSITDGAGTNSVIVTWTATGTISVTYSNSNGCSPTSPTVKNVSVSSQPPASIVSGATTVCPDDVVTYTTESSKFNYKWTIVGGTIQSGGNGYNTVTVKWDGSVTPSVKIEYRHDDDLGLPLVDASSTITKKKATSITTPPAGATVCFGETHTMSVIVDCDGTASYVWKKDGTTVGTNSASYTATASGSYTVEVTGGCGAPVTPPAAVVTVKTKPAATLTGTAGVVVSQVETYTAGSGSNYNWVVTGGTVTAGGTAADATVTVTWGTAGTGKVEVDYIDGTTNCPTDKKTLTITISAQDTPTLITPVTALCFDKSQTYTTQTGKFNYLWTVTNGTINGADNAATVSVDWGVAGTGTIKVEYSSAATATAIESVTTTVTLYDAPAITAITAPTGVCDGAELNLITPTATTGAGAPTITAEGWVLDGVAFTSGTNVVFAQHGDALYYEATNACGTTKSNTENITVYALPIAPSAIAAICPDDQIDLSNHVSATGTLSYFANATGGTALASSLVTPTSASTVYYVEEVSGNGCVSATRGTIAITWKTITAITAQPVAPGVVGLGNPFTLTVTAVGAGLTYQWYKDGAALASETASSLTVAAATAADYGGYYVIVDGECGPAKTSSSVTVDILSPDATLKDLQVNGSTIPGFNPLTTSYTYYVDCNVSVASVVGTPNHPAAAINNTFINQSLVAGDNYFTMTVTAENGFTTKTYTVNLVRDCYAPRILKDLEDNMVICEDSTFTLRVEAEGNNLTYEWYYGDDRIWGATGNSYTVNVAEYRDYEHYQVIIRSDYNGYKASTYSKKVRIWVAAHLPNTLRFAEYPNPATTGKTHHVKLAGYVDVTKYSWSFSKDGVTFSPAVGLATENETWATFATESYGTGTLRVDLEHPCGPRYATQEINVKYPTGVEDVTSDVVTVYPNPTTGFVKVSGTTANEAIRVTDVAGSLKGIFNAQDGTTTIDLTGYAKGTYMLQYGSKAHKVIKK